MRTLSKPLYFLGEVYRTGDAKLNRNVALKVSAGAIARMRAGRRDCS